MRLRVPCTKKCLQCIGVEDPPLREPYQMTDIRAILCCAQYGTQDTH